MGPASGNGLESTGPFAVWNDTELLNPGERDATHFAVHEDTTLFGERGQGCSNQTEGIVCYEDTEFVVGGMRGMSNEEHVAQQFAMGSSPDNGTGFCMSADAQADMGFGVYEDTDLL